METFVQGLFLAWRSWGQVGVGDVGYPAYLCVDVDVLRRRKKPG
jgi:hypothetical protein